MRELKVVGLDADGKNIICQVPSRPNSSSCRSTTDCGRRYGTTPSSRSKPSWTSRSPTC